MRAIKRLDDLVERFFRRRPADLRSRSGAEPLRDLETELDPAVSHRSIERLSVGVGDDEIDTLNVSAHHVGNGVAARAADADHADPRSKLVNFRPDEIDAHDPNPPSSDNALSYRHESLNHQPSEAKQKS
jgi:hypothetical protein